MIKYKVGDKILWAYSDGWFWKHKIGRVVGFKKNGESVYVLFDGNKHPRPVLVSSIKHIPNSEEFLK